MTLQKLQSKHEATLAKISDYQQTGQDTRFADIAGAYENAEPDEVDEANFLDNDADKIGGKVQISLSDMDLPSSDSRYLPQSEHLACRAALIF